MKKNFYLLLLSVPLLIYSCANYNKIKYKSVDFFEDKTIQKNVEKYDFFIHQNADNYILQDVNFQGDSLLVLMEKSDDNHIPNLIPDQKIPEDIKNDIHIYIKDSVQIDGAERKSIHRSEIKEIELYAKEKKGLTGLYLTLAIIGVAIVSIVVVGLIAFATAKGAEAGSNASSDGSTAGSNNNSDGSQGSSDGSKGSSDGSSSSSDGSGCYVATMVYGSYDAPNVLTLRKFRDRFLDKYNWGRNFIKWYYKNSPGFVERNKNNRFINCVIRLLLNVFVITIKPFFK